MTQIPRLIREQRSGRPGLGYGPTVFGNVLQPTPICDLHQEVEFQKALSELQKSVKKMDSVKRIKLLRFWIILRNMSNLRKLTVCLINSLTTFGLMGLALISLRAFCTWRI